MLKTGKSEQKNNLIGRNLGNTITHMNIYKLTLSTHPKPSYIGLTVPHTSLSLSLGNANYY